MYYNIFISLVLVIILGIYLLKINSIENFTTASCPVYVSITSIYKNQEELYLTLKSIIKQKLKPTKIFLYLSEEQYLLDTGFKQKKIDNKKLNSFLNNNKDNIEVKWVPNTGSYRKLIPLLKEKWNEDCIIITLDDDTIYDKNLLTNLVTDYEKHKCVINYRGFTPKINKFEDFDYTKRDTLKNKSLYNFATGKSGILYKPQFFKKTDDLIFDDKIYKKTCDKQDDVWFYIVRILNNVDCYIDDKKWKETDISTHGLYRNFNKKNNNNTVAFNKTLKMIDEKYNYNIPK